MQFERCTQHRKRKTAPHLPSFFFSSSSQNPFLHSQRIRLSISNQWNLLWVRRQSNEAHPISPIHPIPAPPPPLPPSSTPFSGIQTRLFVSFSKKDKEKVSGKEVEAAEGMQVLSSLLLLFLPPSPPSLLVFPHHPNWILKRRKIAHSQ